MINQFRPATQESQLDHEGQPGHPPAEPLDQPAGGRRRAAGGEDVVDDGDALARRDRVAMDLQGLLAVFERIGLGLGSPRKLAPLP